MIQCDLTLSNHIQNICSKARRLVGVLFRQFYHYAEPSTIKTLYLTLIRPNIEYVCTVWDVDPHLIKDRKVLEDVQKFACRVCTKNWHTDNQIHTLLDGLHIPTLEARRKAMRLCFLYKLIDNNTQILPTSQRNCPYTTRSTHSRQLENISCHSSQNLNSYFPQTITDWNNLPASIVSCQNIVSFKYQLYKFMF